MLDIQNHTCHMGKIANNLEKSGEEDHITGFTIPITVFRLTAEQFEAFFDRKYSSRGLHDAKGGKQVPALDFIEPYAVKHSFEDASLTLVMNGGRGKSIEREGCKVKNITFVPLEGAGDDGLIELAFSVYLHPGLSKDNLVLQENQETEIALTIQDAKIATKAKDKQQDLFTASDGTPPEKDPTDDKGSALENGDKDFEAASTAQVAAFRRGRANKAKNGKAART